jgi:hypothetical protein
MRSYRIMVPIAVLALIATFIIVRGSHATDTIAPTVTPANDTEATPVDVTPMATTPPETNAATASSQPTQPTATASSQPAQPARPGCGSTWVQFFDDKGFDVTDDNHMICGPGKWPNLRNLTGATKINWGDEIESLKVGPGAIVTVWTGEHFTGASHTFSPGTERITLKDIPGFSDNISSLEIKGQ